MEVEEKFVLINFFKNFILFLEIHKWIFLPFAIRNCKGKSIEKKWLAYYYYETNLFMYYLNSRVKRVYIL